MSAYYNEFEPYAAQWLRNLIAAGHIAAGDVDERSIVDVQPDDLRGYAQCHFFAGIGGWSLALRLAGWSDDRPIWTGSCPCQPFSVAGAQRGSEDARHLWPAWFRLIRECAPSIVFGEQVAGAAGLAWLDHVLSDMEGAGYAAAAAVVPAGAVGAPHRRERLWFVADTDEVRRQHGQAQQCLDGRGNGAGGGWVKPAENGAHVGRMADANGRQSGNRDIQRGGQYGLLAARGGAGELADANPTGLGLERRSELLDRERQAHRHDADGCSAVCGMGDAECTGLEGHRPDQAEGGWDGAGRPVAAAGNDDCAVEHTSGVGQQAAIQLDRCCASQGGIREAAERRAGGISNPWADLIWLPCADGKARPTQPGLQPLAHGVSSRVGRLRAYGNAIVPQVAAEFIGAVMECRP